jgi:enamine deaminase RidA (YjgF/YER057c/UK114 family)
MTIQRFETGPRMSQVVVHGNTVYLAGVVAGKAAGKSVTEQTQDILSIIDGHLAKAGTDKSKLLSATIYITDMKTFPDMNAVWDGWVSAGNTPARATVEAKLAAPQYNVEIMGTPSGASRCPGLHAQSGAFSYHALILVPAASPISA